MSAKLPLTFTLTSVIAEAFLSLRIKFLLGNLWITKKNSHGIRNRGLRVCKTLLPSLKFVNKCEHFIIN